VTAPASTATCSVVVGEIRADALQHVLDDAGARHGRAHQQGGRDDDDDVVGEAREGLSAGTDPQRCRRAGKSARQVVAQPAHDEEAHGRPR